MDSFIQHIPICPKCGYDQSGEIATWEASCPIEGRCPECGLSFRWSELFLPLMYDLKWYSEHSSSNRSRVWRTPGTVFRLILPFVFWKQVDVSKRVSIWGLACWLCLLAVLMHLLVSFAHGLAHWDARNYSGITLKQYYFDHGMYGFAQILFNGLASPFFYALPKSGGYLFSLHVEFAHWESTDVYQEFRNCGFQLGFILTWVAVLFAIPQTRQITQIRTTHIVRTILIGSAMVLISFELPRVVIAYYMLADIRYWDSGLVYSGIPILLTTWQVVFWICAVRIGWQVRSWKLLALLGTIAAILGGVVFQTLLFLYLSM